ncbi:MAG TPA: hypothetical protein VK619_08125, partial [Pyrinomonadaceae bacterium]|nr:hypothetical protein [Pyrinomonadaceae bacterium]
TRSMTGEMAEFKPVIGYLALAAKIGILPVYIHGTYAAMPKGSNIIRSREIGARIGRYLSYEELEEMTRGLPRNEAYRLISALLRHEVENLRDGTRTRFDARALKRRLHKERRNGAAQGDLTDSSSTQFATTTD